jgi:YD repeat-containing protein
LGRTTRSEFDALDRRIRETAPEWRSGEPRVTEWRYDGNGNLVEERRRNQRQAAGGGWEDADQVRRRAYDARNLLVREEDPLGKAVSYEYDEAGNLERQVDRRGSAVSYAYDARNRRTARTEILGRFTSPARNVVTEWRYDGNGNLTEERLPNGNVVAHIYDALDRRTSSADALGPLGTTSFDARGNAVRATDGNGNVTTQVYDALDRLREEHLPEGHRIGASRFPAQLAQ